MIAPPAPKEPEIYVSPDGSLALCITPDVEGETMVGFHGFEWAIAASQLPRELGETDWDIAKGFAAKVMEDEALIALSMIEGEMVDAWITEHPWSDIECAEPHELVVFRRWTGAFIPAEELPDDQE